MILPRLHVLCLLLMAAPAAAQMSPPAGVLKLPNRPASPTPDTPVTAQPAPVTPVQQVAPFATPQGHPPLAAPDNPQAPPAKAHPKPARKTRPAPVIQAPANVHAQRPASAAVPVAPQAVAALPPKLPETKGSVTGNPLPRWAALRSDEVNLRVGPGTRFPIEWQYHRRDLPVRILRENDVWRLIEDQDGVKGWVHQATLVGHRGFAVKGDEATLRAAAADSADPVAHLKPGVVGRLLRCEAASAWCEVQVGAYRGWLQRDQFYGSDPGEAVGN
jgi:SH3-like domain-containing protein